MIERLLPVLSVLALLFVYGVVDRIDRYAHEQEIQSYGYERVTGERQ